VTEGLISVDADDGHFDAATDGGLRYAAADGETPRGMAQVHLVPPRDISTARVRLVGAHTGGAGVSRRREC